MSYTTERLIKNVRMNLPGSLDSTILFELFNVLDQFFRDTSIWQEDVSFSVVGTNSSTVVYYIEPESVSSIVRLLYVRSSSGFYQHATMGLPGEVILNTPPGQDDIYTATVALSVVDPTNTNGYPEFPAWILEKYGVGILDGVLGRMMAQPAKPYTNAPLAVAHLKLFRAATAVASAESSHRNVMSAQAWMYPQSFSTRSRRR